MDSEILMNLQNEWKYLHVAAKTWRWLKDNPRADQDGVPLHTLVMAMDSAFWVSPQSVETSTMRRCHGAPRGAV